MNLSQTFKIPLGLHRLLNELPARYLKLHCVYLLVANVLCCLALGKDSTAGLSKSGNDANVSHEGCNATTMS